MPQSPVAIVTGASSGVGEATAKLLAARGYRLALISRTLSKLQHVADEILADHPSAQARCMALDVSDPDNARRMIDQTIGAFGRLDVLINNAGVAPLHPIDHTTPETIQQTFATNAIGPACAIARAWPHFVQRKTGRIINVSSMATESPFPGFFAYAASKAALNLMALSCAVEGESHNIRAFAVAPGAIETPILRVLFDEKAIPPEKCLSPEEVAQTIVACAIGEHDDKSGQTILLPSP